MTIVTAYDLGYFEELTQERQKKVAAAISYNQAMNAGIVGKIRDTFPDLYATMYEKEFGKAPITDGAKPGIQAKSTSNYPKELYMWWDELMGTGILAELRRRDFTAYAVIYADTFGKDPDMKDEGLKKLLIDNVLKADYTNERNAWMLEQMSKMTWDELLEKNLTNRLRSSDPETYKKKYYDEYGSYPIMA